MFELKRCPFCGGKMNMTYNSKDRAYFVWHGYMNFEECLISEPFKIDGKHAANFVEAAEVWNKRAENVPNTVRGSFGGANDG